jgi:transcription elongation factor Elf1
MAGSTCPNCGCESMIIVELNAQESDSKLAIRCAVCGATVRVLEYHNASLNELTQRLGYDRM